MSVIKHVAAARRVLDGTATVDDIRYVAETMLALDQQCMKLTDEVCVLDSKLYLALHRGGIPT